MQSYSAVDKRPLMVAALYALLVPSTALAAKKTSIYVSDAVAISPQCLEVKVTTRELPFACHRIVPGEGVVVAEHHYHRSWNADSATYRKLTIRLPSTVIAGDVFQIKEEQASVFFSEGSAAFAGKRGCYGRAEYGSVKIVSLSEGRISVEVNASVPLKSPLDWQGDCSQAAVISQTIKAKRRLIGELNAWEGRPSAEDSPFNEANLPD